MRFASATDLAIKTAVNNGTIRITERASNYGLGTFFVIEDNHGAIEAYNTRAEAEARVSGFGLTR
jgi:hypothetical protein